MSYGHVKTITGLPQSGKNMWKMKFEKSGNSEVDDNWQPCIS